MWRHHSDQVHGDLLSKWLPRSSVTTLLKTDLFDEAHGEGLLPFLRSRAKLVVATDIADTAIRLARAQTPELAAVRADVRTLPFDSNVFDVVVSNSTVDHFRSQEELALSIRELIRVLRPRGCLLLTVDNLANPLIIVRNSLPFAALKRLGLVPYYVGATCGPRRLERLVTDGGLAVQEVTAVEHCPRVAAVLIARLVERFCGEEIKRAFLRSLLVFEQLERLPTRFLTGHFLALRAVKPEVDGGR